MNIFEDLVEDLKKENLLDDNSNDYNHLGNNIYVYQKPANNKTSNVSIIEATTFEDKKTLKIPDFKKTLPLNFKTETEEPEITEQKQTEPQIVFTDESIQISIETAKKPQRRKVPVKNKKKTRYCKNCLVIVPRHRLSCRFCGEKIAGSYFYYYLALIPIFLLFAGLIAVLIIKNYT